MDSLHFFTSILLLLPAISSAVTATSPAGTITRTAKQQILASIPPSSDDNSKTFLTSPSGKYTAYLLRHETAPGAGGYGNDFCYVQVQDTTSNESMWESECAPVSTVNTCSLVLSGNGLEVFDGSNSEWETGANSEDPVATMELVDDGDMRILDDKAELVWKATDEPRANQQCGSPGSPGLAPETAPFASSVGGGRNQPFGQPAQAGNQQQQQASDENGAQQGDGLGSQKPLVDNTHYNGGTLRGEASPFGLRMLVLVATSMPLFFM